MRSLVKDQDYIYIEPDPQQALTSRTLSHAPPVRATFGESSRRVSQRRLCERSTRQQAWICEHGRLRTVHFQLYLYGIYHV